jgi:hypothetical protein
LYPSADLGTKPTNSRDLSRPAEEQENSKSKGTQAVLCAVYREQGLIPYVQT